MKNAENVVTQDVMFGFAHGIRLALEAHGQSIDDVDAIMPILDKMALIVQNPKNSLISFHDDIEYEICAHMRKVEHGVCDEYLTRTSDKNAEI